MQADAPCGSLKQRPPELIMSITWKARLPGISVSSACNRRLTLG